MKPKSLCAFAFATLVAACGGGGGGDGGTDAVAVTIPLATAVANYMDQTLSSPVTITGTATAEGQTFALAGSGTYSEATTSGTFEGQPALRKSAALTATLTVEGISVPISNTGQTYFDASRRPLGATSAEGHCVTTSSTPVPATAVAGANGTWYSMDCFTSASKATRVGTVVVSYVVEPESSSTLLVKLLTQSTPVGGPTLPVTTTYRVSTTGAITRLEDNAVANLDGVVLSMRISYQ